LDSGFRAPLFIGFRWLFASGQIPIRKILGGYLQVATLKSSGIVLFACLLKIHPSNEQSCPFFFAEIFHARLHSGKPARILNAPFKHSRFRKKDKPQSVFS
jgi:hypothetical protein